jgi:hypothetical protein
MTLLLDKNKEAELKVLQELWNLKSPKKSTTVKDVVLVAAAAGATLLTMYVAFELGTQVWRALTCC